MLTFQLQKKVCFWHLYRYFHYNFTLLIPVQFLAPMKRPQQPIAKKTSINIDSKMSDEVSTGILVFSKDRPYQVEAFCMVDVILEKTNSIFAFQNAQLHQMLLSLELYWQPSPSKV